jgi:hypothetical protein
MKSRATVTALAFAAGSLFAAPAGATDGYLQHGYGLRAKGKWARAPQ